MEDNVIIVATDGWETIQIDGSYDMLLSDIEDLGVRDRDGYVVTESEVGSIATVLLALMKEYDVMPVLKGLCEAWVYFSESEQDDAPFFTAIKGGDSDGV